MNTRAWAAAIWTAGLLATGTAMPAAAADLDRDAPYADPYRRHGSPYDDPRYGDIYRHPQAPPRYAEPQYDDRRYLPPMRGEPDDCRGRYCDYPPLPPAHRRYSEVDPRFDGRGPGCVPRAEIRHGLVREGWRDFQDPELHERVAFLKARRPTGQLFQLKIDRCTGEILKAQALDAPRLAPWAYAPRRYDRQYWN